MDLEDLFTIKEYKVVGIDLPCFDAETCHDPEEEQGREQPLHIDIFCSTAASTDWDLTGQILWPVSILLSHFVASRPGQDIVRGHNVVELGAGCGLVGMAASYYCNQVVLTDGNEIVMDLLSKNAESRENVSASMFTWGTRSELQAILEATGCVDVVVAADVVQWPTVVEPLLHSVKALLWNSRSKRPCLLLGIVNRAENIYGLFFRLAKELGFACEKVQPETFLKDGEIPKSCLEYGGRETEIFVVELVDRSVDPKMLGDGDDFVDQENWLNTNP